MAMLTPVQSQSCPVCGRPVATAMPEGLCPACLAQEVLADTPELSVHEEGQKQPLVGLRFFGDYELLEEIGRGGMGIVFRAQQLGLNRVVALKVLSGGAAAGREFVHRFHTEAAAAARLNHPHIVAIYEFGEHEGAHFLAMRFMEGGTIQSLGPGRFTPAEAARLVATIAEALEYAHRHGVLHRDLKPGNILIDKDGQPSIGDFGLARISSADSDLTISNAVLGTVPYLAPEIAAHGAGCATTASDIYGLGAILYQLLAGRAPFTGATIGEVLRRVQETEPVPPSQVIAEAKGALKQAAGDPAVGTAKTPGRISDMSPRIPRDLETICLKCLDKEPSKRYSTAQALAGDLNCFLRGEPIVARPTGLTERAWRWCRRKPIVAGLALALLLVFAFGLAGVLWQWRRAERNATKEARARQIAQAESYTADMNLALQAWEGGNLRRAQDLLWRHVPGPGEQDLRGFEWRYLWKLCQPESLLTITNTPAERVSFVAPVSSGNFVMAVGPRGLRLLSGDSAREVERLSLGDSSQEIRCCAWRPGTSNTVAFGDSQGTICLWDLKRKTVLASIAAHRKPVIALAFSPDGRFLASTDAGEIGGGTLKLWDLSSASAAHGIWTNELAHFCPALVFSPDGKTFISAGKEEKDGRLAVWDTSTGRELAPFPKEHMGYVYCLALSPDGTRLAAAGLQSTIAVWDLAARRLESKLIGHAGAVNSLAFFSDGNRLVSSGADNTIRTWDIANTSQLRLFRGHRSPVQSVALSPDEQRIVSTSGDEVRLWNGVAQAAEQTLDTGQSWATPTLSPDGKWLVTCEYQATNTIKFWDLPSRQFRFDLCTLPMNTPGGRFSPDGLLLAVPSEDRKVYIWKTAGWREQTARSEPLAVLAQPFEPGAPKFSPDGQIMAVCGWAPAPVAEPSHVLNRITFWQVGTWKQLALVPKAGMSDSEDSAAADLQFMKDGRTVAVAYKDGWIRFWDIESGRWLTQFRDHAAGRRDFSIGFILSHDECRLVSWNQIDSKVVVHDLRDMRHPQKIGFWSCGHVGLMWQAMFDPEQESVVSAGIDGRIKFWNPITQEAALTLKNGDGPGGVFSFTPDGNLMVSADAHGTLRFWPAASLAEIPKIKKQ